MRYPSIICSRLGLIREIGPVVGFWEGFRTTLPYRGWLKRGGEEVSALKPDVVVLISFSGFNLPFGRLCRLSEVPVLYIGPPQVWAWGKFRIAALKRSADKVVSLFRFEHQWLRQAGVDAEYFGYPILDYVVAHKSRNETLKLLSFDTGDRYIAFMPGSRPSETAFHEPLFLRLFERLREDRPHLKGVLIKKPEFPLPPGMTWNTTERYDVIRHASCAVVVSGTATAECTILGTPEVVVYHLSQPSRLLARLFVRVPYFAIPNLVAGKRVVCEFFEPTVGSLSREIERLIDDQVYRQGMVEELAKVKSMLGPSGAMERIVQLALSLVHGR